MIAADYLLAQKSRIETTRNNVYFKREKLSLLTCMAKEDFFKKMPQRKKKQ